MRLAAEVALAVLVGATTAASAPPPVPAELDTVLERAGRRTAPWWRSHP
jgi:hypothetical protein